ncbi:glycosyltransferase [Rossellomorea vietnamensis]|uniref:Glycosyl transferase family 1 n=1 Tax=Rossellomorea vietnamensis TaxID=218284 RepID=A0A0P6VY55_9BACI|nr:glycosyltransferase [Rossellomorea vietnamensis]KPL57777.1 glycosyl transferase family 1 [Rossellomorea vietnamensis]
MKKNLLFVIPSLEVGGGEKSLVNLLAQIDYDLYNVDLFLFNHSGLFLKLVPQSVRILGMQNNYHVFTQSLIKSICSFILKGKVNMAFNRLMFSTKNRILKNKAISEQYSWRNLSSSLNGLEKQYDLAIGYLEKSSIYFVVDKVIAKKKVGWIHTNYSSSGMDSNFDYSFFKKLDTIVTVSEECRKSIEENFKELEKKIRVIKNIVSPNVIKTLSNEKIYIEDETKNKSINIITVARLSYEKGLDLAISACEKLIINGYKVQWMVLGEGKERSKLEELIKAKGLTKNFKLMGNKENPYPFIKNSDIYVQPSRYEGKSIALDEAKILNKPIVTTNFETAVDQILHEVNGLLVDISEQGLFSGVERLLNNKQLRDKFIFNLSKEKLGTEEEISKLYELLED